VNSDEKLCPQYLLRTDEMEYHIRPTDGKHPVVLPVGKEGEFKIKKDRMFLKIPDGDHKTRTYQVVAMKPNGDDQSGTDAAKRRPASDEKPEPRAAERRDPVNTTPPPNPATPNALTPPPAPSDPPHR
jgi:hypothetical protein